MDIRDGWVDVRAICGQTDGEPDDPWRCEVAMRRAPASDSTDTDFWVDQRHEPDAREHMEHVLNTAFVPMAVSIGSPGVQVPFQARLLHRRVHDLGLVEAETGPCAGTRGSSRISRSSTDYIAVLILREGEERVSQGGEHAVLCGGDVVVCDTQRAMSFEMPRPARKHILLAPRTAIEEITGTAWPAEAMMLSAANPATYLLTSHLDALLHTAAHLSPEAAMAARTATLYLLAAAASPDGTQLTAEAAPELLVDAMKKWIDAHLLDPELCPAEVAAAHAVSLRTAQRLFRQTDESLAAYIRRRRLTRARHALLSAVSISEIAHHYGFYDAGHFTRAFKAEYGTTPAVYRANGKRPAATSTASHRVG
ncbi:MAG TPA: helix-turn-helix domain-containing protein [Pseudonocardia sp.]|nr:helix-turn-helix domain-containing protein [Pseudonocardia sp.]